MAMDFDMGLAPSQRAPGSTRALACQIRRPRRMYSTVHVMRLAGRQPRHARARPREAAAPLPQSEQEKADIAFRVIADHIRTLSLRLRTAFSLGTTTGITSCAASCAARCGMAARSDSRNRSFTNSWMCWRRRWGMCFPKSARRKSMCKKSSSARRRRSIRHSTRTSDLRTSSVHWKSDSRIRGSSRGNIWGA